MRTYPTNSPQTAGRIVALALQADGHLSKAEVDLLDRLEVAHPLGLSRSELHGVVHGCCEELLASGGWAEACHIDHTTLFGLLAEISDPALRRQVLELCTRVVAADDPVADGESAPLAAVAHRELQRDMLQTPTTGAVRASHA